MICEWWGTMFRYLVVNAFRVELANKLEARILRLLSDSCLLAAISVAKQNKHGAKHKSRKVAG